MRRLACALALALVTFGANEAFAQEARHEPTAGDLATARVALKDALALREKGELTAAVMRFQTAFDLVPTPVTGFELGKTQMMAGRILQAQEHFQKVVRMPPSMEESDRSKVAREESARLAKELEPRIPSLRIRLKLPPGASAQVRIDEEPITTTGSETTRAVDPGSHDVVAKAGDGPEQHVRVEIRESEVKEVELTPQWVPPKVDARKEKGQVVVVKQTTSVLTFVGFAGASAGLALTASAAYVTVSSSSELADKCGARYCPDSDRGEKGVRDGWAIVTVVAGLTTIGFLAAGIVGATNPKKESVVVSGTRVKPTVGLGALGLEGSF